MKQMIRVKFEPTPEEWRYEGGPPFLATATETTSDRKYSRLVANPQTLRELALLVEDIEFYFKGKYVHKL